MSLSSGGNPNIFETEIHSGYYIGTILIELDRIGEKSAGDNYELKLSYQEKAKRVIALIDAIQNLWTVGRQSRFLTDISPKFVAASLMKVKNPIFMETVRIDENNQIDKELVLNTVQDFNNQIIDYVIGERKGFFGSDTDEFKPLGESFDIIKGWVKDTYKE